MSERNWVPSPNFGFPSGNRDGEHEQTQDDLTENLDLGFDGAEDILRAWRRGIRPDPDLTVSEWADQHRKLSSRASAEPGQYRTSRTPYLREIMDALSPRHPAQRVAFMKAAQVGATEAGNNWIGFVIHHAPGPMLAVLPTVEMAKRSSRGRIDPLISESPALRERVNPARSRDAGNSTLSKEFPGGILVLTGANSATGLRSMPARYIFLDEVDAYPASADEEGDPVTLAEARTTTFSHRRKVFMVSTPTIRGLSRIEREFEASDQRRFFVPCPHCGAMQWLQFERLRWAKGQPETAAYLCEGCEAPIAEHHKTRMLEDGEWRSTSISVDPHSIGFHLSALYSPLGWKSWAQIARDWLAAQGSEEMLRAARNTLLGETWVESGDAPEWQRLADRREVFAAAVPRHGLFLTAGADVQKDRIEVDIWAWGRGLESWLVEHVVIPGGPEDSAAWDKLTALLGRTWTHESGAVMQLSKLAIDTGYEAPAIYAWSRAIGSAQVAPIKGVESFNRATPVSGPTFVDATVAGKRLRRGAKLWTIAVSTFKAETYRFLRLERPSDEDRSLGVCDPAGTMHLAAWVDTEWLKQLVAEQMVTGAEAFGGTPSDFAVVEAIQDLKARGKRVTFYPFAMMDVPAGNTLPNPYSANAATLGQPVYPWRGRITVSPAAGQTGTVDKTAAAATQIAAFFGSASAANLSTSGTTVSWTGSPSDWGYRRMVLHYAKLCAAAGGVDSFLIGSELRGLTTARSAASTYPAVAALQTLAADCRAILGPGTKIGYAADWSEYFGHQPGDGTGDIYFHLDPLWADANINFIGVDNYLPLSDWRDGTSHLDASGGWSGIHDPAYLQANIEGGEQFDWFYASETARNTQTRTSISDGAYGRPWVFRPKDFRNWWSNVHKNRPGGAESASATAWVPQSKPIRFTEIGCPAVDKGTNQPNVFFDPKSSESELPHFSSGARDDAIQRRYLEALIGYWSDPSHNPISAVYSAPMIDMGECAVWCWDGRPYPAWPGRSDVWGDTANWEVGHWLNGRLGNASLGELVRSICARSGIDPMALDVARLADAVPGFVIAALESPRASIAPLARYFGFDAVESQGLLRFVPRGGTSLSSITAADLVAADRPEGEDIEFTRGQETELPRVLKWRMLSADEDYEAVTVEARRVTVDSVRVQAEQFAIAHPPATADRNARRALFEAWIGRETASFALPLSRLALDPTDVVSVENDGRSLDFALTQIADGEARRIEASRRDQTVYGLPEGPSRGVSTAVPVVYGPPDAEILDLPQLSEDVPAYRPLAAVGASPWYGQAAIWRSASLDGFSFFSTATVPAQFGTLVAALGSGPSWRFDLANAVLVDISSGSLQSVSDEQLFAGANALALETAPGTWEVLQFGLATIVTTGRWKLTRLLRGQSGTEDAIVPSAPIGSRIVFLNSALVPLPVTEAELGMPWNWRIGPVGRAAGDAINLALAFTAQGRGLRSWSPVRIKGVWQGSSDITLSWLRRTRSLAGDSWNAPEVPLDEASESWDIEILTGGGSLVRTIAGLAVATWAYTAALQTTDFGAPVTSLRLRVFQNGQMGRGAPAEAILTL